MRWAIGLCLLALGACGSDVATARTAEASRTGNHYRELAQQARIDNQGAIECIRVSTTPEEQAILIREDDAAVELLRQVLGRKTMQQCMALNEVEVFI